MSEEGSLNPTDRPLDQDELLAAIGTWMVRALIKLDDEIRRAVVEAASYEDKVGCQSWIWSRSDAKGVLEWNHHEL